MAAAIVPAVRRLLPILPFLLLAGCAGVPGGVSSSTSKFDGERQIVVEPGWLPNGGASSLKLGGFWSQKSPDTFALEVMYWGVRPVEAVKVSIDGEVVDLGGDGVPVDQVDTPRPETGRRYVVPLSLIERMVAAKSVVFQVSLGSFSTEGVFKSGPTCARPAFVSALGKIRALRGA